MKILQVCNKSPYPPRDGGSIAMFSLSRSFAKLGHELTVLTMCTPKHNLAEKENAEFMKIVRLHTVFVDTSVRLLSLLTNFFFSRKPYNAVRFISTKFESKLAAVLNSFIFDVVQLEGLYLAPYINTIRKHSGALIVLRAHNVEHEIWNRIAKTETNPFKKYYYKSLAQRIECFESATMNQYDLLVPITKRDQEHFIRMGNTRPVWVCPSGLEWELSDNQIVPGWNCSLFFLGSLDWKPNQEGLLWFVSEVFPALQNLHPDLKLYIAGRNAPLWFRHKVNLPGIVFCGEVTDAREFIMSKGILVAPYFSGGGMRVKIVEAMALGKPVITTPLGAEGLDVNHNENIIIANSAIDYLEQIEKLLKFPDFYLKIGRNALAFIKQHLDYLKISKALACFYKTQLK